MEIAKTVVPWAILIVLAGAVYYVVQIGLQNHAATTAFQAYLECIRKVNTHDWSRVGGKPGTAGEICRNIASGRS